MSGNEKSGNEKSQGRACIRANSGLVEEFRSFVTKLASFTAVMPCFGLCTRLRPLKLAEIPGKRRAGKDALQIWR
jgi:hypothetical protein